VNDCSEANKEALFFKLASAVADVHEHKYAVGDFSTLDNVLWAEGLRIVFIDCYPGGPGDPGRGFRGFEKDCKEELIPAAKRMFGRTKPASVESLLREIDSTRRFSKQTLRSILQKTNKRIHTDAGQTLAPHR
jgi:hypothetical protein